LQKVTRLFKARRPGIAASSTAPFWCGQTAEALVASRVEAKQAEREAKRLERAEARAAARGTTTRTRRDSSAPRERSPNAQLTRLRRALARRKTLAARQRVAAQIATLEAQLELSL
jgi:hypothetical protein